MSPQSTSQGAVRRLRRLAKGGWRTLRTPSSRFTRAIQTCGNQLTRFGGNKYTPQPRWLVRPIQLTGAPHPFALLWEIEMAREYPRIVETRRQEKWVRQGAASVHKCSVCGAPAIYAPFVQVSWFRGEDEGPFKACKDHKDDAAALIAASIKKASA